MSTITKNIRNNFYGILLCLAIAVPSWLLGARFPVIGGPVFAILAGMILTQFIPFRKKLQPGITYTSKKILQYAVILLGFGLNLSIILQTGRQSLPIIVSTITTSLVVSFIIHKTMHIPSDISTLIGVGSSICGGSAIAATAPVINASDEDVAQSISVIFLFNVVAALIFPALGVFLGMSDEGFGLFAGTAVNDTSSVTAAAAAWDGMHGSNTLETATIVKLTRTLAIIPITLTLATLRARQEKAAAFTADSPWDSPRPAYSMKKIFPFFILYFLLASVITTLFNLSPDVTAPLKDLSKFFIIMAMTAIGLNTNIVKLIRSGGKPIFMGFCCWISIAAVSLGMQQLLGIW